VYVYSIATRSLDDEFEGVSQYLMQVHRHVKPVHTSAL
jgi:hypothetical protein